MIASEGGDTDQKVDTSLLCFLNNVSYQLACLLDIDGNHFKHRHKDEPNHFQQQQQHKQVIYLANKRTANEKDNNNDKRQSSTNQTSERKQPKQAVARSGQRSKIKRKSSRENGTSTNKSNSTDNGKRRSAQQLKRDNNNDSKRIADGTSQKISVDIASSLLDDGQLSSNNDITNPGNRTEIHLLASSLSSPTPPPAYHSNNLLILNPCDDLNGSKIFSHHESSHSLMTGHTDHHVHDHGSLVCGGIEAEHQQLTLSISDEVNQLNSEHNDHHQNHSTGHQATNVSLSPTSAIIDVHHHFTNNSTPSITTSSVVSNGGQSLGQATKGSNRSTATSNYYVHQTGYQMGEDFALQQQQQHHQQQQQNHHHHHSHAQHHSDLSPSINDPTLIHCYPIAHHSTHPQQGQQNQGMHQVHHYIDGTATNGQHHISAEQNLLEQQHWNSTINSLTPDQTTNHHQQAHMGSETHLHHYQQQQLQFVPFYPNHQSYYNASASAAVAPSEAHLDPSIITNFAQPQQQPQRIHSTNLDYSNSTSTRGSSNQQNTTSHLDGRQSGQQSNTSNNQSSQQQNETSNTISDDNRNENQNSANFNHQLLHTQSSNDLILQSMYQHHHDHHHQELDHHHHHHHSHHSLHHHDEHHLNPHHHATSTHLLPLVNGIETSSVILQDINLASATWSASPEDLYSI